MNELQLNWIRDLVSEMKQYPAIEPGPVKHFFGPGVYIRAIYMKADSLIVGARHATTHFNIVLAGSGLVISGDDKISYSAPQIFLSEAGVAKALYVLTDTIWATIHPTTETDLDKLTKSLILEDEVIQYSTKETT